MRKALENLQLFMRILFFNDPLQPLCDEVTRSVNQAGCLVKPYVDEPRQGEDRKRLEKKFAQLLVCQMEFLLFYIAYVNKIADVNLSESKAENFKKSFVKTIIPQATKKYIHPFDHDYYEAMLETTFKHLAARMETYNKLKTEEKSEKFLFARLAINIDVIERIMKDLKNYNSSEFMDSTSKLIKTQKSRMNIHYHLKKISKHL